MTAQLLDGTATAARIKAELTERVVALAARGVRPGLGTLLVGDDPGSRWYVAGKHKDCAEVGIASIREDLPATATQDEIEAAVRRLNEDPECTGFIVQLPLPKGIDTNRVLELVDPDKDADGLHPTNLGRLVLRVNEPVTSPLPCTPRGIIDLLLRHDIDLRGADVVIVGRGVTVGRSIGLLLTRREINATVTLTHTGTEDLAEHTRQRRRRHRGGGRAGDHHGGHRQAGRGRHRRRRLAVHRPGDRQEPRRRRRGPRRARGRLVGVAQPGRRRADDARDAAEQRRRHRRAAPGLRTSSIGARLSL